MFPKMNPETNPKHEPQRTRSITEEKLTQRTLVATEDTKYHRGEAYTENVSCHRGHKVSRRKSLHRGRECLGFPLVATSYNEPLWKGFSQVSASPTSHNPTHGLPRFPPVHSLRSPRVQYCPA